MTERRALYHAGDQTKQAGQVLPTDLQRLMTFAQKVGATVIPLPPGDHTLHVSGPAVVLLATLPDGDGNTSPSP